MTMTDESPLLDWFPQRSQTWPQWMPNPLLNGGLVPPSPPEVPARIAFDWEEGPNGGLIGRPNPLWSRSNSRWWESIPSAPHIGENGGILGSLGQPNDAWHQIEPQWWQSMRAAPQAVDSTWPDPWSEKKGLAARVPSTPKLPDPGTGKPTHDGDPAGTGVDTSGFGKVAATRSSNMGHCLPQYVKCQDLHGGRLLRGGKRCEDCYNMCNLNGYWPFWYCPL